MILTECLQQWCDRDAARDSLPGEHALVAAAGGALIVSALFAPSAARATLRAMLGGALLVRAASGRDGVARWSATARPQAAAATAGQEPGDAWPFPKSAPAEADAQKEPMEPRSV